MTGTPRNVISLALFRHSSSQYEHPNAGEGRGRFFTNCLPAILRGYAVCFPEWRVRIYHDDSIYNTYYGDVLLALAAKGEIDLVDANPAETLCGSMLWRIKPASDPSVDRFLCRDIDSMPTPREAAAVDQWIASGLPVHAIHDSISHSGYMGGMMGFVGRHLREVIGANPYAEAIAYANSAGFDLNSHGADQRVLNSMFAPRLSSSTFCSFNPMKLTQSAYRQAAAIPEKSHPLDKAGSHIGGCFDRCGAVGVYNDSIPKDAPPAYARIIAAEKSLQLDGQAYGNPPPARYVTIASNLNHDYAFYLPIVSALWMRLGYRPIAYLLGTSQEWKAHPFGSVALAEARAQGAMIHFIDRVDGYRDSTVVQTARLAGGATPGLKDDDYILTADVDMLPLSRTFFDKPDLGAMNILYANAYGNEGRPHWPICYIGMTRVKWEQLLGTYPNPSAAVSGWLNGNLERAASDGIAWEFDEIFVSKKIAERASGSDWPLRLIDRAPGGPPRDRIDRGCWAESVRPILSTPHPIVDCHAPRPGCGGEAWQRVRYCLEQFEPGLGDGFEGFRARFAAGMG